MMQGSMSNIVLSGEVFALGTAAFSTDAGALLDDGRRQVIGIVDTCGGIGHISTGTGHRKIFREVKHYKGIMTICQMDVKRNPTTWLLYSRLLSLLFFPSLGCANYELARFCPYLGSVCLHRQSHV